MRGDLVVGLVHGCTQGPSGWEKVQERLSEREIATRAVDLDPARFTRSGAIECAQEVCDQLAAFERVAVVSTSCSGIVAPVVATLRPVERLIFVCAGLPDIGRSTSAQIAEDEVLCRDWMEWDGEFDDPEAAQRFMFHDCAREDLPWALSTVRLFDPRPLYDEVTPLDAWPDVACTYVLGTRDRIISADWARATVPLRLGVDPTEIDTGHCPQNSRPELLAEIVSRAVADEGTAPAGADRSR